MSVSDLSATTARLGHADVQQHSACKPPNQRRLFPQLPDCKEEKVEPVVVATISDQSNFHRTLPTNSEQAYFAKIVWKSLR
mmetsp:Transcript_36301/g.58296  ORF Transcript_36301/g.58296 Transcript_36301/m.58296 type:complete len:81 (+) Transcript_36301:181-423(+)